MAGSKSLPPRELKLKEVPSDVMNIIYDMQCEMKKTAGRHVSMEKAVNRIVRKYKEAREEGKI